jgi:hypothetical protein
MLPAGSWPPAARQCTCTWYQNAKRKGDSIAVNVVQSLIFGMPVGPLNNSNVVVAKWLLRMKQRKVALLTLDTWNLTPYLGISVPPGQSVQSNESRPDMFRPKKH